MRVGFIGCVQFSAEALGLVYELQARGVVTVAGVATKQSSPRNDDFRDLTPLADRYATAVHYYDGDDAALTGFFSSSRPDVIFCFGWSHLLPAELLRLPPYGVVGFHPAALPANRGRHPLIWALVLRLPETASTFFLMDEGADSGPILSQRIVPIEPYEDVGSLYRKVTETALAQIREFTPDFTDRYGKAAPQDPRLASSWRKRTARDGEIDWRMSAAAIDALVRALARPYPGAHLVLRDGAIVRVSKTRIEPLATPPNAEPGKILDADGTGVLVKCGDDSAIWLVDHELATTPAIGDYL